MNISKNLTGANNTRLDPFSRSGAITYVVLLIIESLVIIIGNTIVLAAFTRKQFREKKCYWFCINLTVADLLAGVLAGPCIVYEVSRKSGLVEYSPSLLMDVALAVITNFLPTASFLGLTIISVERMYATLWPLRHRVLGARSYHVMIGLSWTLPLFAPTVNAAFIYNLISLRTVFSIWLPIDCIFSLIIVISYVSIQIKLKFFRHPQNHVTSAQDRKLTMSLFLVTAASMVTIMPAILVYIYYFNFRGKDLSLNSYYHVHNSVHVLLLANSLVNPIIYAFRIPQLRQAVLRLFCRRTTKIKPPAIEMRNRAEVRKRQACAETNMAANE